MADDTMAMEEQYRAGLAAARNQSDAAEENPSAGQAKDEPAWLLMFLGLGFYTLFMIPVVVFLAPLGIVVNYCVVLLLWLWAKMKGLKPPTFSTGFKGAPGKIAANLGGPEVKAAEGAAKAADNIPGASIFFIVFSSGVTPLPYLAALWWNNR